MSQVILLIFIFSHVLPSNMGNNPNVTLKYYSCISQNRDFVVHLEQIFLDNFAK